MYRALFSRVYSVGQRSISIARSQMIGRKVPWQGVDTNSISVGRLHPPATGSRNYSETGVARGPHSANAGSGLGLLIPFLES